MRVFLGITGASGAPYAARLVDSLAAAECEVGICASAAGIQVLATELYGDQHLPRDEVLARFTERAGTAVTVGLAFSLQLVPEVPVDFWDVPVDAVVTEKEVLRVSRERRKERTK